MTQRKRKTDTLTVEDVYRKPLGQYQDTRSLYRLLLRYVQWRRERNYSERTLRTQTHHLYHFILWATERGLNYQRYQWENLPMKQNMF